MLAQFRQTQYISKEEKQESDAHPMSLRILTLMLQLKR